MTETASVEQAVLEKLRLLSPEKQQEVLKFVESLGQENVPKLLESQFLQTIAALSLEERHRLIAPFVSVTATDFLSDPELTEFSVLDGEDWDLEHD